MTSWLRMTSWFFVFPFSSIFWPLNTKANNKILIKYENNFYDHLSFVYFLNVFAKKKRQVTIIKAWWRRIFLGFIGVPVTLAATRASANILNDSSSTLLSWTFLLFVLPRPAMVFLEPFLWGWSRKGEIINSQEQRSQPFHQPIYNSRWKVNFFFCITHIYDQSPHHHHHLRHLQ